MTVEFAVVLPAVALVLTLLVAAVVVVDRRGALQVAAATAARAAGRGDDGDAARIVARMAPGAVPSFRRVDGLVCVDLSRSAGGPFAGIALHARGCSVEGGG